MQTNVTWNPDTHVVFGPNFNPPKTIDEWVNKPSFPSWEPTRPVPKAPVIPKETMDSIRKQLDSNTAVKADDGKIDWCILPIGASEEIIKVFMFGEKKYARGNFLNGDGLDYTRVIKSLLRHIYEFAKGEDNDPESGLSHIAHAGANVYMLLAYILEKRTKNDNRKQTVIR